MSDVCSGGDFDVRVSDEFNVWMKAHLFVFAGELFTKYGFTATIKKELQTEAVDLLVKCRCKQLFEMVAEYPESVIALRELRDLIKQSDNMGFVGKNFRTALRKRLLHMGASTTQILDFYVSMIKALRVLDPSDLMLNFVAAPVREYLKGRKDAVRCIVASLTEGKESDLHGELKQGGSLEYAADEDDEEGGPGVNWEPHKRNKQLLDNVQVATSSDGNSKTTSINNRGLDTLAMLVSNYGSTDLFIVEYRSLLADKLLSNAGYSTDKEVANLELLKIRCAFILST